MKTLFLMDFQADNRLSMDVYSRGLTSALEVFFPEKITIEEFTPRFTGNVQNIWAMRLARYFQYPSQIPKKYDGIIHIVDQGYGHLLHHLRNQKVVITTHDIIPLLRWRNRIPSIKPGFPPILNLSSFQAMKKADHIIAVSNNTKNDIVRFLNCDPDKITVIHSGVDPIFNPDISPQSLIFIQDNYRLDPSKKKILISGSQFYKNNETVLRVVSQLIKLTNDRMQLIKIGSPSKEWDHLTKKYQLEGNIRNIGYVPRDELPGLYQSADLLFFPSLYEGFGWPPLEAMACGTPVVASSAGSLSEILGSVIPLFHPLDVNGFVDQIIHVLYDNNYRQSLVEKGLIHSSKFNWATTAMKTLEVYEKVLV